MPTYDVNYEDKRFADVESAKTEALSDLEKTYSGMINESDGYFQNQINEINRQAEEQKKLQQEQTDFTIDQIEQQKEQAEKDYIKEQSGAYVDWQKQSNQHGVNAEQMAAQGMTNTGYSESAQVAMYNTYQNRVATARESFTKVVMNFDNAIKEAKLQNNAALAEIAFNAMVTGLEVSLEGFQYKNDLIREMSNKKLEVENTHYNRYMDVLDQINTENELAERVRQFDTNLEFEAEQARLDREFKAAQEELDREDNKIDITPDTAPIETVIAGISPSDRLLDGANPMYGLNYSNIRDVIDGKFDGSTSSEAVSFMKQNGVSDDLISGLMDKNVWGRAKAGRNKNPEVANYNTYEEYLKDYVAWAIEQSR